MDFAAPVLAIQGSPRRGGNTDILLDKSLEVVRRHGVEAQKIYLRDLKFSPCLEINACLKTGECPIKDEMTPLYPRLITAPVIIVATPIFFYGPSAQLKAFIDRCQAFWGRKYRLNKGRPGPRGRGYVVSAGATSGRKLFDGLMMTVKYLFDVLDVDLSGELLVRGVDEKGAINENPEELALAGAMGEDIARYVSGLPRP
jgi:multimeric flavodoxin WrbA